MEGRMEYPFPCVLVWWLDNIKNWNTVQEGGKESAKSGEGGKTDKDERGIE